MKRATDESGGLLLEQARQEEKREDGLGSLPGDPVQGWSAIATRVTQRTGLNMSSAAIVRLSKRQHDPLPVRRWGGSRPRIVADGRELDRWSDRQWRAVEGKSS
jgi:hypothetical protein